jgi:hypothetical protein
VTLLPAAIVAEVGAPLAGAREKSVPLPDKETVCGLFDASSLTVRLAVRLPAPVGLNVTLTVQFALGATLVPQVFVSEKSPLFTPNIARLEIVNFTLPVFERLRT